MHVGKYSIRIPIRISVLSPDVIRHFIRILRTYLTWVYNYRCIFQLSLIHLPSETLYYLKNWVKSAEEEDKTSSIPQFSWMGCEWRSVGRTRTCSHDQNVLLQLQKGLARASVQSVSRHLPHNENSTVMTLDLCIFVLYPPINKYWRSGLQSTPTAYPYLYDELYQNHPINCNPS